MDQDFSELTTCIVDSLYGQLPSRVFSALASSGRSTLRDLVRKTGLSEQTVASTLVVLVRQHLVYHYTTSDTHYHTNGLSAYNVFFRTGKLAEIVEKRFGPSASGVLTAVAAMGHATINDLKNELGLPDVTANGTSTTSPATKRPKMNGSKPKDSAVPYGPRPLNLLGSSQLHLQRLIADLLRAGFLQMVTPHTYAPSADLNTEAIETATETFALENGGKQPKSGKEKKYVEADAMRLKRKWMDAQDHMAESIGVPKPRKQLNLNGVNGNKSSAMDASNLPDDTAVMPNWEKLAVILRNQQLSLLSHRYIGENTSKVFDAVARALEGRIRRTYDPLDPQSNGMAAEDNEDYDQDTAMTDEILQFLEATVDLEGGLANATRINGRKSLLMTGPRGDDSSDAEDDEAVIQKPTRKPQTLKRPSDPRLRSLEQHLSLLAKDPRQFLLHHNDDAYSIPYLPLTRTLLQHHIEETVAARHGTLAARVVRILQDNYSTEEKELCQIAIEKTKLVRAAASTLQQAGIIDTQEIPRDNNRTTNRLVWLWTYSPSRAREQLIADSYRSMTRLLHRLSAERAIAEAVLGNLERYAKDRDGSLENNLSQMESAALEKWRNVEKKVMVSLSRIDDLVACLRDFSPMADPFVGNRTEPWTAKDDDT